MNNFTNTIKTIQPEFKSFDIKKSASKVSFWWLTFVFTLLINAIAFSQAYNVLDNAGLNLEKLTILTK